MNTLSISLRLQDRPVLLAGTGSALGSRLELLDAAAAEVTLLTESPGPELAAVIARTRAQVQPLAALDSLQLRPRLVFLVAGDRRQAEELHHRVERFAAPINVQDQPDLCDFFLPSLIDRSPVQIAISSGGNAPALLRRLREKIEGILPDNLGALAQLAGNFRARVRERIPDFAARRAFWERAFDGEVAEWAYAGDLDRANLALARALEQPTHPPPGDICLVGAGPGNPDLLSFKALRLMQRADVVLYDRLVARDILSLARRDAEKIFVGKSAERHVLSQQELNQLMIKLAESGKRVCRLKGGDPFTFGRGGEELAHIKARGIAFQVVPGITAAAGAAAYTGIPLTHRDCAQTLVFITGHGSEGQLELDWPRLAGDGQTLVFYMGLRNLERIAASLVDAGAPPERPAAVVERATTLSQRVVTGTLADIARRTRAAALTAPVIIIVGKAVELRTALNWLGDDPESLQTER